MQTISIVERYFLRVGDELLDPLKPRDLKKIATHLSAPQVAEDLAATRTGAKAVVGLMQAMPLKQQVSVLSALHAVHGLAYSGKAAAVVELVKAMPLEQQAAVLSALHVVHSLAHKGKAGAVVELVKVMPLEQQAAVLSAPGAVHGLAYSGKAGAVVDLLKAMTPRQQKAVLSGPDAVRGLADNGQRQAVEAIELSLARTVRSSAGRRSAGSVLALRL